MTYQQFKIILGSDNDVIFEDPVLGSNGTAVVTKINNLIDALDAVGPVTPVVSTKGAISTINNDLLGAEITPGPDKFCLVADSSSYKGLVYEERVDLVSAQTINGNKSFIGSTSLAQALVSVSLEVEGHSTLATLTSTDTSVQGMLSVGGPASLASGLNVIGNSSFTGSLALVGSGSISNNLSIGSNLAAVTGAIATLSGTNLSYTTGFISDLSADDILTANLSLTNDLNVAGDGTFVGILLASNLSGTNTGDEVAATPTLLGLVKTDAQEVEPTVYLKSSVDDLFIKQDQKAVADGVATLGPDGLVPLEQLPPFISDAADVTYTRADTTITNVETALRDLEAIEPPSALEFDTTRIATFAGEILVNPLDGNIILTPFAITESDRSVYHSI